MRWRCFRLSGIRTRLRSTGIYRYEALFLLLLRQLYPGGLKFFLHPGYVLLVNVSGSRFIPFVQRALPVSGSQFPARSLGIHLTKMVLNGSVIRTFVSGLAQVLFG